MSNKKLVIGTIFGVLLVATLVGLAVSEYFKLEVQAGYDKGCSEGYSEGHSEGLSEGYDQGFLVGNSTGYQIGNSSGYNLGFSDGNMSGYDLGYDLAYELGYNEAYIKGFSDGNASGYDNGYTQGLDDGAGHGYTIRDPTYQEALQFINDDRTDANQYDDETYTCANFAADFKNNAFDVGYRCGYVGIEFPIYAHAIVCFNTIDKGLIFIEPQDDEIVSVRIGYTYWDRTIYEPPTYDDTVVRYMIVW